MQEGGKLGVYGFGLGEESGVGSIGEEVELCAGNQGEEGFGGFGRHEGVGHAVEEEKGGTDGRGKGAQVGVAQPVQAGEESGGGRAGVSKAEDIYGDGFGVVVATVEAADEAREHGFGVLPDGGGEVGEHGGRHGMWPAFALDEGGSTREQGNAADFVRVAGGDGEGEHGADGPAAEGGTGGEALGQQVDGIVEGVDGGGVAVAGEVKELAVESVGGSLQGTTAKAPAGKDARSSHDSKIPL